MTFCIVRTKVVNGQCHDDFLAIGIPNEHTAEILTRGLWIYEELNYYFSTYEEPYKLRGERFEHNPISE